VIEMKVNEGQLLIVTKTPKRKSDAGTGGDDFRKIMEQADLEAQKAEAIPPKNITGPVGGVQILEPIQRPEERLEVVPQSRALLRELEDTLDLVDFYSAKLGDSSLAADGLAALVDHLEERIEYMKGMGTNPDLPGTLRGILSDMLVTIGTEIAKFKRGDYV
jgi:hypothetical protein